MTPTILNDDRRKGLYARACDTPGFFTLEEAEGLIDAVAQAGENANFLEIGSFRGRSALFFASAMKEGQRLFCVDAFVDAAKYSEHSLRDLDQTLTGVKATILPMKLTEAFRHLRKYDFDIVFVDGDHSLLGFTQDVCLSLELLRPEGILLCHDVAPWFPAIPKLLNMLVGCGVLEQIGQFRTLGMFAVRQRPQWLTKPDSIDKGSSELSCASGGVLGTE